MAPNPHHQHIMYRLVFFALCSFVLLSSHYIWRPLPVWVSYFFVFCFPDCDGYSVSISHIYAFEKCLAGTNGSDFTQIIYISSSSFLSFPAPSVRVRLLVLARKAQAVFCLVGHRNKEEEEI